MLRLYPGRDAATALAGFEHTGACPALRDGERQEDTRRNHGISVTGCLRKSVPGSRSSGISPSESGRGSPSGERGAVPRVVRALAGRVRILPDDLRKWRSGGFYLSLGQCGVRDPDGVKGCCGEEGQRGHTRHPHVRSLFVGSLWSRGAYREPRKDRNFRRGAAAVVPDLRLLPGTGIFRHRVRRHHRTKACRSREGKSCRPSSCRR